MSETSTKDEHVSPSIDQPEVKALQILEAVDYASRKFGQEFSKTQNPSVLIALHELAYLTRSENISPSELKSILNTKSKFEDVLLIFNAKYEARRDQEVLIRLASLDRNTHWKMAAGVSLGTGMVTGLAFAVAGPFFSAFLQPTADKLAGRSQASPAVSAPQLTPATNVTNVTNNNYFQTPQTTQRDAKPVGTLSCKNVAISSYPATLLELLKRGDIVTLELNGKKTSLCYRPGLQATTRPLTIAH